MRISATGKIMRESAGNRITWNGAASGTRGFLVYTFLLFAIALSIPPVAVDGESRRIILFLGALALWRYSWGFLHYLRYLLYSRVLFPALRHSTEQQNLPSPSRIYIVLTSFRIDSGTSVSVFGSTVEESIRCGLPVTIVCSFVELSDEFLMKRVFEELSPPDRVRLLFVRIPGTGKRDGLAQGFRAISRDFPAPDSLVIVLDGDSMMQPDLIRKCVPFFAAKPALGALTTDEECTVHGSEIAKAWHHLRFSQRQILMGSVGLSNKVLTLTGRMSMFRASIITHPDFIHQIEHDAIDHWRLGRFKFLTGDDKSSWFWVLKNGYDMMYIPDVVVITSEYPPSPNFFKSSTMLMLRWFGNMLRTNGRALALGPKRTGFFTWWCLLDQRISMWTSLIGPVMAIIMTFQYNASVLALYIIWIGFTRWVMSLMLLSSRPVISWYYPFLIYYNQVWGSLVKTYVFFHLDRQSWTRQKTHLRRDLSGWQGLWVRFSSSLVHGISLIAFVTMIGLLSGALNIPESY